MDTGFRRYDTLNRKAVKRLPLTPALSPLAGRGGGFVPQNSP